MANTHQLERAQVDALRGLQEGSQRLPATDPVWRGLASAGLVERRGAPRAGAWSLTMRGRFFRTD